MDASLDQLWRELRGIYHTLVHTHPVSTYYQYKYFYRYRYRYRYHYHYHYHNYFFIITI